MSKILSQTDQSNHLTQCNHDQNPNMIMEAADITIKQKKRKKERKGILIGKERIKLPLFTNMMIYINYVKTTNKWVLQGYRILGEYTKINHTHMY